MKIILAASSNHLRGWILKSIARLKCSASIFECMNVEETIEAYSLFEPDAIILDYKLIGGNSMDVLETIKHQGRSPLVIVLTDSSNPEIKKLCLNLGAKYVFNKSKDIEKIPEALGDFQEYRNIAA